MSLIPVQTEKPPKPKNRHYPTPERGMEKYNDDYPHTKNKSNGDKPK